MATVSIAVELENEAQALALAQFCKRLGFCEYRVNAVSEDEAYEMRSGIYKLSEALADQGFNPR